MAVVVVVTVALVDVVEETVVEEDTVEVDVSVKEVEVELLLDDVLDVPWPQCRTGRAMFNLLEPSLNR